MGMMQEHLHFHGTIRIAELPDGCSEADYRQWWPRITECVRDRYTVAEHHNILTLAGRAQLLSYIASSGAVSSAFGQFIAIGNLPVVVIYPGQTSVVGEYYRSAPSTVFSIGSQIDLAMYMGPSQAVGTMTNAGIYGNNATATPLSGTLYTHTLLNYVKGATPVTMDYLINLE
jgi:hypothetical protein